MSVTFPNSELTREIQIVNILGQIVYKTKTQNDHLEIDIKSLHLKGVVLVKVFSKNGVSDQKVVIE